MISPIEEIIEEARQGRVFVLVDAEDRENEGDLVIAAQHITPEIINFMAKEGRGLICLSLTAQRCEFLGLPLMSFHNQSKFSTAFTLSIEAREGVTTGISAYDRAHTIQVAIDAQSTSQDIVMPGHIFPLKAARGGVLERAGHTEAAVDIARLAGLNPSGVICEIMRDDGHMARLDDLFLFGKKHNIKIGTIYDLIVYRRKKEKMVQCLKKQEFVSAYDTLWQGFLYENIFTKEEHVAFVYGKIVKEESIYVRVQAEHVLDYFLGSVKFFDSNSHALQKAMRYIESYGSGVVIFLRESHQRLRETFNQGSSWKGGFIDYGIGSQILEDIGAQRVNLLVTRYPKSLEILEAYGLKVDNIIILGDQQ